MSDIDQQFIEYVVKSLVGNPDAVHIDRRIDEKGVLLELTVDPEDLGRVIGKRGATAQSLRTLLRALGTKNDARYNLKIIDNGDPDHGRSGDNSVAPISSTDQPADNPVSTDDNQDDVKPAAESQEEPEQPKVEEQSTDSTHEDQTSDRMRQMRAELADLDDLDVWNWEYRKLLVNGACREV